MDKKSASTLHDMVKYVASDLGAFFGFIDYLDDEYLLPEPEGVEKTPTLTLSKVAETFEMDPQYAFTNWFQHEALGHRSGRVTGLHLAEEAHRLRLAQVFILEDILSDEAEDIPEDLWETAKAHEAAGRDGTADAIYHEFDAPDYEAPLS